MNIGILEPEVAPDIRSNSIKAVAAALGPLATIDEIIASAAHVYSITVEAEEVESTLGRGRVEPKPTWRFKDYDSQTGRGTLCHLYEFSESTGNWGPYLGSVWADNYGDWVWESDIDDAEGKASTRREAKVDLRAHLKVIEA